MQKFDKAVQSAMHVQNRLHKRAQASNQPKNEGKNRKRKIEENLVV